MHRITAGHTIRQYRPLPSAPHPKQPTDNTMGTPAMRMDVRFQTSLFFIVNVDYREKQELT
jgi:hypothetical protein